LVIHFGPLLIRRLLIRPGAIGDFIVSLPAMEALRKEYTEVWCSGQNVPLARFADSAQSIVGAGLDRVGLLPADEVIERLRSFDSIISWYGANHPEFQELAAKLRLPFQFLAALPSTGQHAVDFYTGQARELEANPGSLFPEIGCPPAERTFAVIHPFASSLAKRAPMALFEEIAIRLSAKMPVHWLCGPEEELKGVPVALRATEMHEDAAPDSTKPVAPAILSPVFLSNPNRVFRGAVRIDDLYELACWLRRARIFVGNDSGISHLAAAVGTPVQAFFRTTDPRIWAPRGPSVNTVQLEAGMLVEFE
jgi:heptosyltransferase III